MSTGPDVHSTALPPPRVEEVSDGVYAYVQPDGSWWINNAGFLVGREGVVVVDTTSTERRGRALVEAIGQVTRAPLRTLVNTHFHGDHTHANYLLPAATIIGHEDCRRGVMEAGVAGPGSPLNQIWPGVEWGDLRPAPPFVTFTDRITIWVDDLEVQCIHVGPAHTTSDVVLWVPARGTLFAGDTLFNGGTPFLLMGSVRGSLATLEQLRALGAKTIVAGHGPVGGPEIIDAVEAYVRFLDTTARAAKDEGLSPLEAARQADLGPFADLTDAERLAGNLHRAYAELDGAAPGAPIDIFAAIGDMLALNSGHPLRCFA